MINFFDEILPDEYVESVFTIDLDKLWQSGKRLILSDLDNTLVPWNHPHVPDSLARWYEKAAHLGFKLCIVSNNRGKRVAEFGDRMGIEAIGTARKPRPDAFEEAMHRFGYPAEETVMLGDQLFTDIRGGNRCGIYTILVVPIDKREWWGTRINRMIERLVMRTVLRHSLQPPAGPTRRHEPDGRNNRG